MPDQDEELLSYLRALVTKTEQGQIAWRKANPTTYTATIIAANAKMTLQSVQKPASSTIQRQLVNGLFRPVRVPSPASLSYVFQLNDANGGSSLLSLNAENSSAMFDVLGTLFKTVTTQDNKRGLDVLRKVIS